MTVPTLLDSSACCHGNTVTFVRLAEAHGAIQTVEAVDLVLEDLACPKCSEMLEVKHRLYLHYCRGSDNCQLRKRSVIHAHAYCGGCRTRARRCTKCEAPFAVRNGEQQCGLCREGAFRGGRGDVGDVWLNGSPEAGLCAYCGSFCPFESRHGDDGWHVDHIVPLSQGGPDQRSNVTLACASCNLKKSARTPAEFVEYVDSVWQEWRIEFVTRGVLEHRRSSHG